MRFICLDRSNQTTSDQFPTLKLIPSDVLNVLMRNFSKHSSANLLSFYKRKDGVDKELLGSEVVEIYEVRWTYLENAETYGMGLWVTAKFRLVDLVIGHVDEIFEFDKRLGSVLWERFKRGVEMNQLSLSLGIYSLSGLCYHFKKDRGHQLQVTERYLLLLLQIGRIQVSRHVGFEEADDFVELVVVQIVRCNHAETVVVSENWLSTHHLELKTNYFPLRNHFKARSRTYFSKASMNSSRLLRKNDILYKLNTATLASSVARLLTGNIQSNFYWHLWCSAAVISDRLTL